MQDNSSENWSLGCYIVQYQMNRRSSSSRDEVVPYEAYYGWTTISEVEKTLGAAAQKIRTEVGLQLIEDVLVYLQKNHPSLILEHETVLGIIERGDALYDGEAVLETVEELESYDILTRRSELYNEIINDINAKNPRTLSEGDDENGSELDEEANDEDSYVSNDNNGSDDEETDEAMRLQHKENCRVKASQGQEKQARRVNASRSNDYKEILEVGDICLIRIEGTTKAATDKGAICVKVTRVRPYTSPTNGLSYRYRVCTRDGYIDKLQLRNTLEYQEQLTAEIMGIDETKEDFLTGLSVTEASKRYNVLGGSSVCRCLTDCSKRASCSCRKLGNFCSTRCHGGRGKNIYCTLCYSEE
jgi:hypothetical protein